MECVLIAAGSEKSAGLIAELLRSQYGAIRMLTATNAAHARRLLPECSAEIVILSMPLLDETGEELAVQIASETETGVLLLVKSELAEQVASRVEDAGVFVVEKPLHRPFFFRALRLLYTAGQRVRGLESEKVRLEKKIEEIRLVDRAKCALIQYLNLTEQQAHKYIEKQAMDMRIPRREVALSVLKTYEA